MKLVRASSLLLMAAVALSQQRAPAGRIENSQPRRSRNDDTVAIVVNHSNPLDNLSSSELRAVFLGERTHWPNGRRITLVMMEPGIPERDTILRQVCRMSEADFRRHFLQGLLTGEVLVSPKTLASPVGVRKFVFNVPGAIGYLRPADIDATIKVLRIDGYLPSDPEYKLHLPERAER
jgi:ABC-type phosphate transport system substrate-binding protein